MEPNIITSTDAYKVSHHLQYPPGTEKVYCYFESRGGKFPGTLFFGLQYILKRHLVGQVVTAEKIEQAEKFFSRHLRTSTLFNSDGWKHILEAHDGYLPLRIKAVPEGTIVPTRNVLFTVENTDLKVPWLTGYVEVKNAKKKQVQRVEII